METLEDPLCSQLFLDWTPDKNPTKSQTITFGNSRPFVFKGKTYKNLVVDEKHFAPAELAKAWGLSAEKVRQMFRREPGVLRIGSNGDSGNITLRIPQSVAVRVHTRLTAIPQIR